MTLVINAGALHAGRVASLDVAAASGLVLHDGVLFVIADDGILLHRYATDGTPLPHWPLFPGQAPLPREPRARKRVKPDLEALALLPGGHLLALGSGSAAQRRRGVLVNCVSGATRVLDLAPLYGELARHLPALNIEGAVVHGDSLLLAQRGNGHQDASALVVLNLATAEREINAGILTPACLERIVPLACGLLAGVPLAPTDLAVHRDGSLWLVAAAEDVDNAWADGACSGSVLCALDEAYRVVSTLAIAGTLKIEGICQQPADPGTSTWWLVADADDPDVPAPLLTLVAPAR